MLIHHMFHILENPNCNEEIPRNFKRKVEFLRKSIKKLPLDCRKTDLLLGIINDVNIKADLRHHIVHGAITKHKEGTGQATFSKLDAAGKTFKVKEVTIDTVGLLKEANALNLAGRPLREINQIIEENWQ